MSILNNMMDYCASNGIKTILNLGDLYTCRVRGWNINEIYAKYRKLLENTINLFPSHKGIYHSVLGGNHDKRLNEYGIDALSILSKEREDFISLGYDSAFVTFNNQERGLMLHHHMNGRITNPDISEIEAIINKYYENNLGQNRDNTTIDLLGHIHQSALWHKENICLVPSLMLDRYQNGAWHLKVHLNVVGQIDYLTFIPIEIEDTKLIPQQERLYRKRKLR